MVVAIIYIVVGRRAVSKVKALREEVYPERTLKAKFNKFDEDGDGTINFKEFYEMMKDLDVDISYQGSEMLFVSLDRNLDGHLDFAEFLSLWSKDPLTLTPV
mmetsp:Transcript_1337/g.1645  ORF Transcript_1337/g.1645 Transcript_1337/m.1645 type:complete len:102 (+) Transcript_1337:689-994(+)